MIKILQNKRTDSREGYEFVKLMLIFSLFGFICLLIFLLKKDSSFVDSIIPELIGFSLEGIFFVSLYKFHEINKIREGYKSTINFFNQLSQEAFKAIPVRKVDTPKDVSHTMRLKELNRNAKSALQQLDPILFRMFEISEAHYIVANSIKQSIYSASELQSYENLIRLKAEFEKKLELLNSLKLNEFAEDELSYIKTRIAAIVIRQTKNSIRTNEANAANGKSRATD